MAAILLGNLLINGLNSQQKYLNFSEAYETHTIIDISKFKMQD